jgi:hypothetical protein
LPEKYRKFFPAKGDHNVRRDTRQG